MTADRNALGRPSAEPVVVVHWTLCYPCQFGEHRDPAEWHTWAGAGDIEHAHSTGQPDPSAQPCGCACSGVDVPPSLVERRATVNALRQAAVRIYRSMPGPEATP